MLISLPLTILITIFTSTINQTLNPTLKPHEAVEFQNWYMERLMDPLPLLETIRNCDECPRIYLPICGSDNKTYTNLCWMNCMNLKRGTDVEELYEGLCLQFLEPFEY